MQQQARRISRSSWQRGWNGAFTLEHSARALAAGLSVLALFLLVLEVRIFSALPPYAATALVFGATLIVPGLFLYQALLSRLNGDLVDRLVFSLPLGLAIAAPAGLLALLLHLDLQTFNKIFTVTATLTAGGATLFFDRNSESSRTKPLEQLSWAIVPLLILLTIAVGAILTTPVWAGDSLSRDLDDWRYMANVNSYMAGGGIDSLEPVGIGEAPFPRFANNVWLVVMASTAQAAGVTAEDVVLSYLTPLLTVFALAATYALAKGLFRSRTVGLMAAAILLGHALLDVSPQEGIGRNLLLRIAEDKMVGTYIFFPLGLLLISTFFSDKTARTYVAFTLLTFAIFVIHPFPLTFLLITLASFAILRVVATKSSGPLRPVGYLMIPLVGFTLLQYVVWLTFNEGSNLFNVGWAFRESFRIVRLGTFMGQDLLMGNYHLIIHPVVLAALFLAPLALLRSSRTISNQLLFAAAVGWMPFFFIPPLATVFGKFLSGTLLIRLPLMTPAAVVLAYLLHEGIQALQQRFQPQRLGGLLRARSALFIAAPTLGVVLLLGSALLVQETYFRADGRAFYERVSTKSILPGTERSIFLGGKDRLVARDWRTWIWQEELFEYLRTQIPPNSIVFAPPLENIFMPGKVQNVRPVHSHGVVGLPVTDPFVFGFYNGRISGEELREGLERRGVDYVVGLMPGRRVYGVSAVPLPEVPGALWLADVPPYRIYIMPETAQQQQP